MFDFFGNPSLLLRFGLVLAAMFGNGAFWASGRPRLQTIASLLLGTFVILLILVVINHGWIAGLLALVAGLVSATVGGLTVGPRLTARGRP